MAVSKLSFIEEGDFNNENMKRLQHSLRNKTSVVLNHADFCGHCQAMKPEFELFKKQARHDVFEFESGVLPKLSQYPNLYKGITPSDGSMYFPMIFVFVIVKGMKKPQRFLYEGPRKSENLKTFVKEKKSELRKMVKKKKTI